MIEVSEYDMYMQLRSLSFIYFWVHCICMKHIMVMSFLGLFWTRGKVAHWPGSHSKRHVFPGMWYGCTRVWFWRGLCLAFSPTQPMTFRSSPITALEDQRESAGPGLRPCKPVSIPVVYSGVRVDTLQTSEYPSGVFRC